MKPIATAKAPAAIGPYSQAIHSAAGLIFVSGQLPIDPAPGAFPEGGVEAQTRQSILNARAAMNGVYSQFFQAPFPARSAVAVKTLPKGALVEIECIAEA